MADQTIAVVGCLMESMREFFVDRTPLGGKTVAPQHRGGMNIPIDGLNDEDCQGIPIVAVLRRYNSDPFPQETDSGACNAPRAVLMHATVARCAKTFDEQGNPPTPEETDHEALVLLDDAQRLGWALTRAGERAEERGLVDDYSIGAWETGGPDGGVVTGTMTVAFQLSR